MENEKLPVKLVNKSLYEEIFSTRFIVSNDNLKQNSESPVWSGLKLPADLIIKDLDALKNRGYPVSKITLQITATAILDVTVRQDD